jgi:hypothetical protein
VWPFSRKPPTPPTSDVDVHRSVLEALAPWRLRHRRTAWRPVVGGDRAGLSQFGGAPALTTDEAWPNCGGCGEPIDLFLQLDGRDTPPGSPWHGPDLLQVFYCRACEVDHEGWAPFAASHLLRRVPAHVVTAGGEEQTDLSRKAIVEWVPFDDLPATAEHDALGLRLQYDFKARQVAVRCDELGVFLPGLDLDAKDAEGREIAEAVSEAAAGDKLGGWPCWVQGVEYPACPSCGASMHLVFQIDSEDNLDHMFGDVGCAHVTQCPQHPDVLALAWACA